MRARIVADGTKTTSGTDLIIFSWGTLSPAFFAAMAAGGVTKPVINYVYGNRRRRLDPLEIGQNRVALYSAFGSGRFQNFEGSVLQGLAESRVIRKGRAKEH
uniref:Uncharacterized protein n=1 Tax=Opuntia streptacantha TaxID=393608 RepID=A0A7C8Z6E3_OPUST